MVVANKLFFIHLCLTYGCVVGHRISKSQCDEIALLNNTDPSSRNPHLMEIVQYYGSEILKLGVATLISETFVLTSSSCLPRRKKTSDILVRKLRDDEYLDPDSYRVFTVARIIRHKLLKNVTSVLNDIALIQLKEEVPFNEVLSIYRPACLWSSDIGYSFQYLVYGKNESVLMEKSVRRTPIEDCSVFLSGINNFTDPTHHRVTSLLFCVITNSDFYVEIGSPIIVQVENENYIFGITAVSRYIDNTTRVANLGPKITLSILSWIESIVWSEFKHLDCGKQAGFVSLMLNSPSTIHGQFPWHVAINEINVGYVCGGTIIGRRTILTAAHCLYNDGVQVLFNRFTILAGTHSLNITYKQDARIFSVEQITVHNHFNLSILKNDIAILKLVSFIEFSRFIAPICVSKSWISDNFTLGVIVGWGETENKTNSNLLRYANFSVYNTILCRNIEDMNGLLNDHNYCAKSSSLSLAFRGDSGGAMIFKHKDRWYIGGILSVGIVEQIPASSDIEINKTKPYLFTNVTILYDWIVQHVHDDDKYIF